MKPIKDIPNSALPIAKSIRIALQALAAEKRKEVLESMTEAEFIDYRVDIYLSELEIAIQGGLGEAGAQEIAVNEAMGDLLKSDD